MSGFGSMGAAAAGAEALDQVRARQQDALRDAIAQKYLELAQRREDREREQQESSRQQQADNAKYLNEQRQAMADLRNQQRADRLTTSLVPGSQLDAGAVDALKSGDLGSLVRHEASQLPSTAISGVLRPNGTNSPLRIVGLAKTANAGHDERDIYQGTAAQQQAQQQRAELQRVIEDPDTPGQVRQYLKVAGASPNKGSLPSSLFQSPDQPVYQLGADGVLRQAGTVPRGARVTNAPRPTTARLAGADNPQIPRGAQQFAIDIANKHGGDYNAALAEANQYLSTQQDHPSLSPQKFIAAVQSAMRRPSGTAHGGGQQMPRVFGGSSVAAGGAAPGAAGGTVKMRAPDGTVSEVSADQVAHYTSLGAKVVR